MLKQNESVKYLQLSAKCKWSLTCRISFNSAAHEMKKHSSQANCNQSVYDKTFLLAYSSHKCSGMSKRHKKWSEPVGFTACRTGSDGLSLSPSLPLQMLQLTDDRSAKWSQQVWSQRSDAAAVTEREQLSLDTIALGERARTGELRALLRVAPLVVSLPQPPRTKAESVTRGPGWSLWGGETCTRLGRTRGSGTLTRGGFG